MVQVIMMAAVSIESARNVIVDLKWPGKTDEGANVNSGPTDTVVMCRH